MDLNHIYRRAAAPLAHGKIRRSLRAGLPPQFEGPLASLFSSHLDPEARSVVERVEAIRAAVAANPGMFHVTLHESADTLRTGQQIAHRSSVTRAWGTFLFLCARAFDSRTILELGSCAGISGCYLSSAPACQRFMTVEASPNLAALAASNLARISPRFEMRNALFNDALDQILPTLDQGLDLVYIDGHHELEPTLNLWKRVQPHLNKGALIIFDDIRWSAGMWKAWGILRRQEGFACTVDVGRFGLCLWDGQSTTPSHYNFALYAGWLRVQTRTVDGLIGEPIK